MTDVCERIRRSGLVGLCLGVLLLAGMRIAQAADRVALVIGNGAYEHTITLPNPPNDARAMATLLRGLNFEVIEGEDLTKDALDAKLREFAKAAESAKVTFVFYAGHGMQVGGKNYLIPIDAKLADASALDFETVSVDRVINYAKANNAISVVLLDACRDDPLTRRFARSFVASRSVNVGQGLAVPDVTGGGIVIGFATAPGQEASDGAGDHSPFTAALLRHLATPGLEIQQALTRVTADVYAATKGEQDPWHNSNLRSEFYLNPAAVVSNKGGGATIPPEEALWQKLATSDDPAAVKLYVDAYPNSPHIGEARVKLAALTKNEKFRAIYSGELRMADSSSYVAYQNSTITREGPGGNYASRFTLNKGQTVRALGRFDSNKDMPSDLENSWVKIATSDGNEGFALLKDLLSPEQYAKRKRLLEQKDELKAVFERAMKGWGPLTSTAGVWTFGSKCIAPIPGGLNINLGLSLFSRWIWWTEGDDQLRVNALHPDKIYRWHFSRRNSVNLRNTGRVRLYRFASPTSKDTDLMGFKGDQAFFHKTGNNYGIANRCGTIGFEQYETEQLWTQWVDVAQRMPDKK